MPVSVAEQYAQNMMRAWHDLDDRMAALEQAVRDGDTDSAVYIASELREARRPLIAAAADAGTFAAAYDLGAAEALARADEASRVVPLHAVREPITA